MATTKPQEAMVSPGRADFSVEIPDGFFAQDQEWCYVILKGERHKLRFHDYDAIYKVPGLYEHIFYDRLRCNSPSKLRSLLESKVEEAGQDPTSFTALDLGAGNGMMGQELANMGIPRIVGSDILEEAATACRRDRPGIYERYLVTDFSDLTIKDQHQLTDYDFNCLTCVAALGFGDIPPGAFVNAFNLIADGGWVVFNIKEDFLTTTDPTGFQRLVRRMVRLGNLSIRAQERYCHRLAMNGIPLHYMAMVGIKQGNIPAHLW